MLIGITGAPGCGKDTLAYELMMHDAYERYRFADPIKRMLREFHIQDAVWEDRERKEKDIPWLGRSPRYLAQTLGTEWGRNCVDENVWLLLAQGRWHHVNAGGKGRMVIPDVRFENEARWVHENGILVEIVRPRNLYEDINGVDNHPSESGVSGRYIDCVVVNNGSKEELRDRMWAMVKLELGAEV